MTATTDLTIPRPDTSIFKPECDQLLTDAHALEVNNEDQHRAAQEGIKKVAALEKKLDNWFKPMKQAADAAKKAILDAHRPLQDTLKNAKLIADNKCMTYEAKAKAEAEAEQRRLAALAKKEEEDRMIAEAEAAQAAGDNYGAAQILSEPVEAVVPTVKPAVAKVAGKGRRDNWSASVDDYEALVKFVAEDVKARKHLLQPNQVALNGEARAKKAQDLGIPGVKGVNKPTPTTR